MQAAAQRPAPCRAGLTCSPPAGPSGRPPAHAAAAPSCRRTPGGGRVPRDTRARITNTNEEIPGDWDIPPEDQEYIMNDTMQEPPDPTGKGRPLSQRVSATYEEAIFTDEISPDDTKYWFTEPEGGWNQEPEKVKVAPKIPNEVPTADHPGDGRTPIEELQEGAEMTGVINRLMLYHGAQVDLGANYDGLIPVDTVGVHPAWPQPALEALNIDTEVRVRVHKVREPGLFRWPVQLELLSHPEAAECLPPPESHRPRLDLRGRGPEDIPQILKATGRSYRPYRYWMQMGDHGDAQTQSWQTITRDALDASESEGNFRERNDESLLDRISEIAASL